MDCSVDSLKDEENVVKFIFISLGVAFGKQVPKDMKTKLGTHPTLIWLNISIMNYCIKINNQLSNENLVLYKIVAPEYVAMICNYKERDKACSTPRADNAIPGVWLKPIVHKGHANIVIIAW